MIEYTKDYLEEQIEKALSDKLNSDKDSIVNILSLVIYSNANNLDIVNLYKNLDMTEFLKVIDILGGHTVLLPDRPQMKEAIILSILYYYREIKGYNWDKIKSITDFEINTIKYGIRIKQLSNFVQQKIGETFKNLEKEESNV
jgi:hypothetical protein